MTSPTESVRELLRQDRFPFRVAIFPGLVAELGEVLEAQADVPEAQVLEVSRRLNVVLGSESSPLAVGTAFLDRESEHGVAHVPVGAMWFQPEPAARRRNG